MSQKLLVCIADEGACRRVNLEEVWDEWLECQRLSETRPDGATYEIEIEQTSVRLLLF